MARKESTLAFDWGGGSPDSKIEPDTFSAAYEGSFDFEAGTYRFDVAADDGVRIYVDGNRILDKWQDQMAKFSPEVKLTSGKHTVKVEYYEQGGGSSLSLKWSKVAASDTSNTTQSAPTSNTTQSAPVAAAPAENRSIDLWWPTNLLSVRDPFPIKALVKETELRDYDMYWSVDGMSPQKMYDSQQDHPHKEVWADPKQWPAGKTNYTITLTARNQQNQVIASRTVEVKVER